MTSSFPYIYNNIIVNNTAGTAGAFSIKQSSSPTITNNTIANNVGVNGAFLLFNSQPTLVNCIVITEGNIFASIASSATVTYSCLSGGYTGEGNIDAAPLFEMPSQGNGSEFDGLAADWHLSETSPCIDAGDPNPVYNDLDELRNDMGAYGWNGFPDFEFTDNNYDLITPTTTELTIYPNPFNPSTNISFELSEASEVVFDIYNIKGQLITNIASGKYNSGRHQVIWNAEKFASGVYFIRFKYDTGVEFQKLVLMK